MPILDRHARRVATAVLAQLLFVLMSSRPTHAQPALPTARVVLDTYVNEAIGANLSLARQREQVASANAEVREARGRLMPSLDVNARYSAVSGAVNIGDLINPAYGALNGLLGTQRFPTDINATLPFKQETKLELAVPIFNGAIGAATAVARARRDLVGAGRHAAMRRLAADVQRAWLVAASVEQAIATLEATFPVLDENIRVSQRLIDAGQATPDVLLRARSERSDIQQQLNDARRQRNEARRAFNLLRNREPDAAIVLARDSSLLAADSMSRDAAVAHAMTHREELHEARVGIALADARRRLAGTGYLPSLALTASYGIQGNTYRVGRNSDIALANLVFSWNLFSGGRTNARREQATTGRDEAELQRRETERAVRVEVENAYDGVQAARGALVSADDRLASAQRAFMLVERRYAAGLAPAIEFLGARSSYTAAAINQIVTRFTFATRVVELERAAALRSIPE